MCHNEEVSLRELNASPHGSPLGVDVFIGASRRAGRKEGWYMIEMSKARVVARRGATVL